MTQYSREWIPSATRLRGDGYFRRFGRNQPL
jgi:hypothetical protein